MVVWAYFPVTISVTTKDTTQKTSHNYHYGRRERTPEVSRVDRRADNSVLMLYPTSIARKQADVKLFAIDRVILTFPDTENVRDSLSFFCFGYI